MKKYLGFLLVFCVFGSQAHDIDLETNKTAEQLIVDDDGLQFVLGYLRCSAALVNTAVLLEMAEKNEVNKESINLSKKYSRFFVEEALRRYLGKASKAKTDQMRENFRGAVNELSDRYIQMRQTYEGNEKFRTDSLYCFHYFDKNNKN